MTDRKKAALESSRTTSHENYSTALASVERKTDAWGRANSAKGNTRRNRLRKGHELQSKLSRACASETLEAADSMFAGLNP